MALDVYREIPSVLISTALGLRPREVLINTSGIFPCVNLYVVSALSNIQAVGTQRWMGNDSYSASGSIAGADDGDTYNCTASNGCYQQHSTTKRFNVASYYVK